MCDGGHQGQQFHLEEEMQELTYRMFYEVFDCNDNLILLISIIVHFVESEFDSLF